MDVTSEDQALQEVLNCYNIAGIDNEALDTDYAHLDIQQLEEYITGKNNAICFPDETMSQGSYNNDRPADANTVKTSAIPTQPSTCTGPGPITYQNTHATGLNPNAGYISGPLPDSPPDSGSEPYSPPEGNQDMKNSALSSSSGIGSSLSATNVPSISAQVFMMTPNAPPSTHAPAQPPPPPITSAPGPSPHAHKIYQQPPQPYGAGEPPKLNHPPVMSSQTPASLLSHPQILPTQFTSMNNTANHTNKKRKYSDSPQSTVTPGIMGSMGPMFPIKQEPSDVNGMLPDCSEDDYSYGLPGDSSSMFMDGAYQVIKWQAYQPTKWTTLYDENMKELPAPSYRVDADKGFTFSVPDDAFVCQKKNHFQVTVHIGVPGQSKYVKVPDGVKPIDSFYLHFHGIKMESPTQVIKVEQSQSDRSKRPFNPVKVDLPPDQVTKVTVGRLHFSETTTNNMRKKGKPNPDQRYFLLVVALQVHSGDDQFLVAAHMSERIIVRASNPGQFENDMDILWQKGHTPESVYHAGRVGINTDRPDEALTIHGNIRLTGHLVQQSDERAKQNFQELDPKEQLKNVSQLKVYKYEYNKDYANQAGISDDELEDTGVIAQEVQQVIPDAVKAAGDFEMADGNPITNFLVVNKDRIYMENVGAVKELCKLTDNLENRIDELEKMNRKLRKVKRIDSTKSTGSMRSQASSCGSVRSNGSPPSKTNGIMPSSKMKRCSTPPGDQDTGLCSNRFIQITVIILVLVMAFCLVSITTLYIYEKQKTSPRPGPPGVVNTVSPNRSTLGPGVTELWGNRTTDVLKPPPLRRPRCINETCATFCCPPPSATTRGFPTEGPQGRNAGPPHPNQHMKHHGEGPDGSPGYPGYPGNGPVEVDDHHHINEPRYELITVDPRVDTEPQEVIRYGGSDGTVGRKKRDVRATESTAPSLLPLRIMLAENKMNVDRLFCANEGCRSGVGGNYSYVIPVDATMPPVIVHIQMSCESQVLIILCDKEETQICEQSKPHSEDIGRFTKGKMHDWYMPATYFFEARYRFRMSHLNHKNVDHVCTMSSSQVGTEFAEYSLTFQRSCPN